MTDDVPDARLLAHLAEALEPGPRGELEGMLHRDAALRARLEHLRRRVEPPPARFRVPPPGLPGGRHPVQMWARPAAVMGTAPPAPERAHTIAAAPGARWRLHIAEHARPDRWMPVVLELPLHGDWAVAYPEDPEDVLTLADLPKAPSGSHLLDLAAPSTAGSHRVALALAPASLPVAWDLPPHEGRWRALARGLEDGSIPVVAIQVDVEA